MNLISQIILVLAFVFNIFIFAPVELYYSNISDLFFSAKYFLPIIIVLAIIVFCLLMLGFKLVKNKKRYSRILFTLLICLYIQGNYLNINYPIVNGSDVDWIKLLPIGIVSTIFWIILIIFPYKLKMFKNDEKLTFNYERTISLVIFLIEVITLIVLIYSLELSESLESINVFDLGSYFDSTNIENISSDQNVVVFVADTFEATYLNELLEAHPEYKEKLKDFTYFNNVTTTSTLTHSSMPLIITGVEYGVGKNLKQNMEYCFENTDLYDVLTENNYQCEIYTENSFIPNYNSENNYGINNIAYNDLNLNFSSRLEITRKLYKFALYRYMPHFLKMPFVISSDEFNNIYSEKINMYTIDDIAYYNDVLSKKLTIDQDHNDFKIIHLDGIHLPFTTNENFEIVSDTSDSFYKKSKDERLMIKVENTIKLLIKYVDNLKEANAYDNTTILLIADHGWYKRQYVTLLAKKANYSGDFEISNAPVSLLEDLKPTILNAATNTKDYGKDIWDYSEGEERTRKCLSYIFTRNAATYNILGKFTYAVNGQASESTSYSLVNEEYSYENNEDIENFKFNKTISFDKNKISKYCNTMGILLDSISYEVVPGYTVSNNESITLKSENIEKDVEFVLDIGRVFYKNQNLKIKVNGVELYSNEFECDEGKNQQISFVIPKDVWNLDTNVKIEFETPNADFGDPYVNGEQDILLSFYFKNFKIVKK